MTEVLGPSVTFSLNKPSRPLTLRVFVQVSYRANVAAEQSSAWRQPPVGWGSPRAAGPRSRQGPRQVPREVSMLLTSQGNETLVDILALSSSISKLLPSSCASISAHHVSLLEESQDKWFHLRGSSSQHNNCRFLLFCCPESTESKTKVFVCIERDLIAGPRKRLLATILRDGLTTWHATGVIPEYPHKLKKDSYQQTIFSLVSRRDIIADQRPRDRYWLILYEND